jgi:hypothetical protein
MIVAEIATAKTKLFPAPNFSAIKLESARALTYLAALKRFIEKHG